MMIFYFIITSMIFLYILQASHMATVTWFSQVGQIPGSTSNIPINQPQISNPNHKAPLKWQVYTVRMVFEAHVIDS